MARGPLFTPEEDKILLDCIGKNALNIRAALESAHQQLPRRSVTVLSRRWYRYVSLQEENLIYLTQSFGVVVANRKKCDRGSNLKITPQTPSKKEKNALSKSFMMYNFVTRACNREFSTTSTDEFTY